MTGYIARRGRSATGAVCLVFLPQRGMLLIRQFIAERAQATADKLGIAHGIADRKGFGEATHQEVEASVVSAVGVLLAAEAVGILALANCVVGHDLSSGMSRLKARRTLEEKSWKSFLDAPQV